MRFVPPNVDSVRPAQAGDVSAVLRLWSVARSPAATTGDDAATVEHLLAHDPGALLVAQRDEQIVGTVIAGWDGWRGNSTGSPYCPNTVCKGLGDDWWRRRTSDCGRSGRRGSARSASIEPGPIAFWTAVGYQHDPGMARFAKSL